MIRLSWQWSRGERIGRHLEIEPLVGVVDVVAAAVGLHHQIAGVEAAVPRLVNTHQKWKFCYSVIVAHTGFSHFYFFSDKH